MQYRVALPNRICAVAILLPLAVSASRLNAQQMAVASPESVGLSSVRLQRIEASVAKSIADKQIAGAVTMVVRHGKVAWLKAAGHARS